MIALTIRARLTFAYSAVLAAILLVYAAGVYATLRQHLFAELDRQIYEDFEAAEAELERTPEGRVRRRAAPALHHEPLALRWTEVWSTAGELWLRDGPLAPALPAPEDLARRVAGDSSRIVETLAAPDGAALRARGKRHEVDGATVLLRALRPEDAVRRELAELAWAIAIGLPFSALMAAIGGYVLAGRALAPVARMAEHAQTITADRLGERLPIANPADELGRLGTVFNATLARLETSFDALRRFTADAAHELRTPLTAIRSVGEVGVARARGEAEYREVIGSMLEETDRLTKLVEALLECARADAGRVQLALAPTDLVGLAREAIDVYGVLAEERGLTLVLEGEPRLRVRADPLVLRQATRNLLANAIAHGPRGEPVRVVASRRGADAVLAFVDAGVGIAPEHHAKIFERFYRTDPARARATGGAGLGLSIARWAVQAHAGRIELTSAPGHGSTFSIVLPLDPDSTEEHP